MDPKIFGIGFHLTGTTELGTALAELGYRTCGARAALVPFIEANDWRAIDHVVGTHQAFVDNPWPVLYQALDKRYPGSKFILTIRDRRTWMKKVMQYYAGRPNMMRQWIYGHSEPDGHRPAYLERFLRHNIEVQHTFAHRPQDLLVMDLDAGDGWQKLAAFLGQPVPNRPFPGHSAHRTTRHVATETAAQN